MPKGTPNNKRGWGEGSIKPMKNGKFRVTLSAGFDGNGKRLRVSRVFDTKTEAIAWRQKKLGEIASGQTAVLKGGSLKLGEWFEQWVQSVKTTTEPNTSGQYEQHVNRYLKPRLGNIRLDRLNSLLVQKLYNDMIAEGVSASMVKKAGVTLGICLQAAVLMRLVAYNPVRGVPKPKHQPEEINPLTPEEAGRFLVAARQDRLYALYALWLETGAREGELFALPWDKIDWHSPAVTILYSLEEIKGHHRRKELKSRKSRRRIPIGKQSLEALEEHRKQMLAEGLYQKDGPVFCDTDGGYLRKSNVQRRSFEPILAAAKLRAIRPYDLRHTAATLLLLAGVDVKIVADRLGHSTTRLTLDTYQHVIKGMQEGATEKIDAILRAAANLAEKNQAEERA